LLPPRLSPPERRLFDGRKKKAETNQGTQATDDPHISGLPAQNHCSLVSFAKHDVFKEIVSGFYPSALAFALGRARKSRPQCRSTSASAVATAVDKHLG
jgi:hypothetical protein